MISESKGTTGAESASLEDAIRGALEHPDRQVRGKAITGAARNLDPEELIDAVADQANHVRRNAAIDALTKAGARAIPTLLRALRHQDSEVVMFAAGILGKMRDPCVLSHLVALLDHEDMSVAQAAIESLASLRATHSVEPLIRALDRDPWLRFSAVHALGAIGDPRAVSALRDLVSDEMVGGAAVLALGRIGSSEALGVLAATLRRSLEDEDRFAMCVSAIGDALEQQPDERLLDQVDEWNVLRSPDASHVHLRLLKVLNNDHGHTAWLVDSAGVKGAAADVIRALKLRSLYGALVGAGRDPALREHLRFCIVSLGSEMAAALAIGICSPDRNVRLLACQCVGVLALPEMIPQVERLLHDRDDEIRAAVVYATSRVGREAAASTLANLLDDPSDTVREAVVASLRQMDAEAVTCALVAAPLASLDGRELALEVMGANPHPLQRAFVQSYLRHEHPALRIAAVRALARAAAPEIVDVLRPLLEDPVAEVRREVVVAFSQSRTARARELLLQQISSDPETRTHAIRSLGELGDSAVAPLLTDMIERETPLARIAIISALADLREPSAEPLLVRALTDDDLEVRREAVSALGRFATPAAVRHGLAAARDPAWQVRAAAVDLLATKRSPASLAVLERLCFDPHPFVAEEARRKLEEARAQ